MSDTILETDQLQRNTIRNGWGIEYIVESLSEIRTRSLNARNRFDRPTTLPSKAKLNEIVQCLSSAMFPHRLSHRQLHRDCVDFFVGQQLDTACTRLSEQIAIELDYSETFDTAREGIQQEAILRTKQVVKQVPEIRELLDADIETTYLLDPAAKSQDEVLACYPGIRALIHHRIAHVIYQLKLPLVARMISEMAHSKTGIDIHPGAQIGSAFFIDHGTGVVIGETTIIGNNVRICHGVTLGGGFNNSTSSVICEKEHGKVPRHPIVQDDVTIHADATILGRVNIGQGSIIGSNVCVTDDIPAYSHVSQARSSLTPFIGGAGI